MSKAYAVQSVRSHSADMEIQPLPEHKSANLPFGGRSETSFSTTRSVSGLGIRTSGVTMYSSL